MTRILDDIKNPDVKPKLIEGLNKLGFPLEHKIRQKLINRGYEHVQEGKFGVMKGSGEIVKSYDINGYLGKSKVIHKELTIKIEIQLVGDCKFSSDNEKFIFAIPDTSNSQNNMFIGPLLSAFLKAELGKKECTYA